MQQYILFSILGFLSGVLFSSFENSSFFIISGLVICFCLFVYSMFFEKDKNKFFGFCLSLFFLFFSFGQIRFLIFQKNIPKDLVAYEEKKIEFKGEVFKQSQSDGLKQKVYVNIKEVKEGDVFIKREGRVLVFTSLYPKIDYGANIYGYGKITKPETIEGETGVYFNYPKYLEKDKISHLVYFGDLNILNKEGGNFFLRNLLKLKNTFLSSISNSLNEPESSLMSGILLGEENISKEVQNTFRISGLSHIIVLSGYNITIVAESILKFLLPITSYASFLSVFSIFLFVIISGGTSSGIRAGMMACIAILGRRFGKTYDAGRALFFAGFIMILFNPMVLLYDPSFHLSFLATFSIIYFSPIIFEKIYFITNRFSLREILATTLSAQFFVLPYIIFMTGKVSLYSLFSNILVLPFIPLSMFSGFWLAILGMFSKFIAIFVGFPLSLLLSYFIKVAQFISKLPHSQISVPSINIFILGLFYIPIIYFLFKRRSVK